MRHVCYSLLIAAFLISCRLDMAQTTPQARRDINAVLRDHDRQLMALANVIGVYVGLLDDGKTPCLKVMLSKRSPETDRAIPRTIEGYPVIIEVSGEIRPLSTP
jgi:hypothetical protein